MQLANPSSVPVMQSSYWLLIGRNSLKRFDLKTSLNIKHF